MKSVPKKQKPTPEHNTHSEQPKSPLNKKQTDFANLILQGHTAIHAYQLAYDTQTTNKLSLYVLASRVRNNKQVANYIDQCRAIQREQLLDAARIDREQKLIYLETQISDLSLSPKDRQNAIKLHNEMTGDNAPVKVEIFNTNDIFDLI